MRLGLFLIPVAATAAGCIVPPALAQTAAHGDAGQGRVLAETWCSSCHAVAPGESRRSGDVAPSLTAIAARPPAGQDDRLRSWLHAPHPPMQGIDLSRQQVEDIVAYLRSLSSR